MTEQLSEFHGKFKTINLNEIDEIILDIIDIQNSGICSVWFQDEAQF
jgi:hypothetical protein